MRNKAILGVVFGASLIPLAALAGSAMEGVPETSTALHFLVGKWKGKGAITVGKDSIPVKGKYACKQVSGGFGIGCTAELTGVPGLDKYRQQDMWGYDAGANQYHWFTITNAGETHDHAGQLTDDGFTAKYEGTRGGKPMVEKVAWKFDGDDVIRVKSEVFVDGQLAERLELLMER